MSKTKTDFQRSLFYALHRECVRRNPQYGKAYKRALVRGLREDAWTSWCLASEWGLWNDEEPPDPEVRQDLNRVKQAPLTPSSRMHFPSEDTLGDEGIAILNFLHTVTRSLPEKIPAYWKGKLFLVHFSEDSPPSQIFTVINMRQSKEKITESFIEYVRCISSERQRKGLRQARPQGRRRLEEWFDYLKVYDLRKAEKTFGEIAHEMWPRSEGGDRRAKRYYKKAESIIMNPPILREHSEARGQR